MIQAANQSQRMLVLRNRYNPMDLFELVPAFGLELEPALTQLDRLLDDDRLFQTVRADLVAATPTWRPGGAPRPRSRLSCGCWSSSACTAGATPRPSGAQGDIETFLR